MAALVATFRRAGIDDAAQDARHLLCAAVDIDHSALIREPELAIEDDGADRLGRYAARRLAREPVTRILGSRGFWSLEIEVGSDVLDPRPDSETLIDAAIDVFAQRQQEALRIADFGSGSGALLCALLDVFPNASGVAIDISPAATALTRRNLHLCGMSSRARVAQADWSDGVETGFDLIVSNPPYIASGEIAALDPEVRNHDPALALDGGQDGLDAYRDLSQLLPEALRPGAIAILEIGSGQAANVVAIMAHAGLHIDRVQKDLGGVERALVVRNPASRCVNRPDRWLSSSDPLGAGDKND
jgi:release factor glutamine methyltransferase